MGDVLHARAGVALILAPGLLAVAVGAVLIRRGVVARRRLALFLAGALALYVAWFAVAVGRVDFRRGLVASARLRGLALLREAERVCQPQRFACGERVVAANTQTDAWGGRWVAEASAAGTLAVRSAGPDQRLQTADDIVVEDEAVWE
jgi:hypothetical protein